MRVVKWWFFSLWTFNMRNTRESNINISLWLQKYPRVKNSDLSVYPSRSYFKLCFACWETPLCLAFSLVGNVQKCWGFICLFLAWISYWRNFSELRWCKTQKMRCWVFGERCQKLPALSELNRPQQSKRREHSAALKKHILSSRRGLLGACLSVRAGKNSADPPPVHASAALSPLPQSAFWSWAAGYIVSLLVSLPIHCHLLRIDFIGSSWGFGWFSLCSGIARFLRLNESIEDDHRVSLWAREGRFGCMIT